MVGIITNVAAVALGGLVGALCGDRLSDDFVKALNSIFGICALGMGISSIILMENMPAVILAVIVGTAFGLMIHLGEKIGSVGVLLKGLFAKNDKKGSKTAATSANAGESQVNIGKEKEFDVSLFVTALVLFCSSGTGIYGSIDAGMTGNVTILLSKSILDFFTAAIFACNLGIITSVIAIPQFMIFGALFLLANVIYPLTTPTMINDFKACGGFVLLATGLRIAKVKEFPIADMIPSMIIVMPISAFWVSCIVPLL